MARDGWRREGAGAQGGAEEEGGAQQTKFKRRMTQYEG